MQLPITNYDVTTRDIIEILYGVVFVIFGLVFSIIIANIITGIISPKSKNINDKNINIFLLSMHIIIILLFLMFIRYLAEIFITNSLILTCVFSFVGPTIGISSLYLSQNFKSLVGLSSYIYKN